LLQKERLNNFLFVTTGIRAVYTPSASVFVFREISRLSYVKIVHFFAAMKTFEEAELTAVLHSGQKNSPTL